MTTNSQIFRDKLNLVLPSLYNLCMKLYTHNALSELYPEYLILLHTIIRASVPLMDTALNCSYQLSEHDPLRQPLCEYFTKHILEEKNHDEWLLEDLQCLGVPRSGVLLRMPSTTVAALVGSQYYWVKHYHPVALLGYIGVLEGSPPSISTIELIKAITKLPDNAFRTLVKHSHIDFVHKYEFDLLMDNLPLTPKHNELIGINAFHTVHLITDAFQQLIRIV